MLITKDTKEISFSFFRVIRDYLFVTQPSSVQIELQEQIHGGLPHDGFVEYQEDQKQGEI
jgi:hypothetical protein